MSNYDKQRMARDLLSNPLLPDLMQEMKKDITDRFPSIEPIKLQYLQHEYQAIERLETALENLIHRDSGYGD